MKNRFTIHFDPPRYGWMHVTLSTDEGPAIFITASHIYKSVDDLLTALALLLKGSPTASVSWDEEPQEFDFCFEQDSGVVYFEVVKLPHGKRTRREGAGQMEVFSSSGTVLEICLPFWRALRALQCCMPLSEFETAWDPFPVEKLAEVNRLIKGTR